MNTVPYRFCKNCAVDYKNYIAVLQGDEETGWLPGAVGSTIRGPLTIFVNPRNLSGC